MINLQTFLTKMNFDQRIEFFRKLKHFFLEKTNINMNILMEREKKINNRQFFYKLGKLMMIENIQIKIHFLENTLCILENVKNL